MEKSWNCVFEILWEPWSTYSLKWTSHSVFLRRAWLVYCILCFLPLISFEAEAYLHWHLLIKWLKKNFIATKKQKELKFFMPLNSLPAPSLPEQSLSMANETCSSRKKRQKTVPHPLPPINKLQSPHEIKGQPINQVALTIWNGSKSTPGFNLRRADGNFHLWW